MRLHRIKTNNIIVSTIRNLLCALRFYVYTQRNHQCARALPQTIRWFWCYLQIMMMMAVAYARVFNILMDFNSPPTYLQRYIKRMGCVYYFIFVCRFQIEKLYTSKNANIKTIFIEQVENIFGSFNDIIRMIYSRFF